MAISGYYKDFYFRSLHELAYVVRLDKKGIEWVSPEHTGWYITYTWRKLVRRYYPDFIVGNVIVEIKPPELRNQKRNTAKRLALLAYCKENGYEYKCLYPKMLAKDELRLLYNEGLIVPDCFPAFFRYLK